MLRQLQQQHLLRQTTIAVVLVHLMMVLAMAVCPDLHSFFHHDADDGDHDCAVTHYWFGDHGDGAPAQPVVIHPISCEISYASPPLSLDWVPSVFVTLGVFEHAPPVARARR